MSDPSVMRDAIKALRAESGRSHDAERTHARIVGSVILRKRQRRQVITTLLIAFVGLPLAGTAYAAFFGAPVFAQQWLTRVVGPSVVAPAAEKLATSAPTPNTSTPSTTTPPTNEPNTAPITTAPPQMHDTPRAASTSRSRAPSTQTATIERARTDQAASAFDRANALYERAHELHFVTRDSAAALVAWDVYLAHADTTALHIEAQYNRALCLVRLHRNTEAIEALTPFANGAHGNYRKREATALLAALNR